MICEEKHPTENMHCVRPKGHADEHQYRPLAKYGGDPFAWAAANCPKPEEPPRENS